MNNIYSEEHSEAVANSHADVEDYWMQCSTCGWEGYNSDVLIFDNDGIEFCPECLSARIEPAQDLDVEA